MAHVVVGDGRGDLDFDGDDPAGVARRRGVEEGGQADARVRQGAFGAGEGLHARRDDAACPGVNRCVERAELPVRRNLPGGAPASAGSGPPSVDSYGLVT